jgi:peptide/nickel transport system substrate-binding protein
MLALCAFVVLACGPTPARPGPGPEAGDAGGARAPRKTLTIPGRAEPGGLAHLETTTFTGATEIRNIYHAGLAVWDHRMEPRPLLAQELPDQERGSMRLLPDGSMEVTYRIRSSLTWDDGAPFTAHDMAFSWKLGADPEIPVLQRRVYQLADVVEARDDLTLATHWPHPYAFARVIHAIDIFPAPRHLLEDAYRTDKEAMLGHPWFGEGWVGLGPYRLARWERGSHMEFVAREAYPLGTARIDRIVLRFFADANAVLTSLLAGTIDVVQFPTLSIEQGLAAREQWERRGLGTIHHTPTSLLRILAQPRSPTLQDPRLRQTLLHGIDRPELAESLSHGLVRVAHSFLHPREPAFTRADQTIAKYPHNATRGSQLLADLGWRRGSDGELANAAGERLVLPWQLESGDQELANLHAALSAQWGRLGITLEPTILSRAAARSPEAQATFPGLAPAGGDTTIQNLRLWWHSSAIPRPENRWTGNNRAGWANPRADALLDELYRQLVPERQQEMLVEIAQLWANDLPALPLWFQVETVAISSRLRNAYPRPNSSGAFATLWNVAEWELVDRPSSAWSPPIWRAGRWGRSGSTRAWCRSCSFRRAGSAPSSPERACWPGRKAARWRSWRRRRSRSES